jgi:2-desacetyl-2-hydroxyethyl bacteriochlorophyllide A dehydrogenase
MTPQHHASKPETSVIVRTFNEAENLPVLLQCLADQCYRNFEVVVVDSGSVDSTRDIARAAGVQLECIDRNQFTFGYSLNAGIRRSRGAILAIVSAHAFPVDHDWLETLIAPFRDKNVAMVYGRQMGTAQSNYAEMRDFHRTFRTERHELQPSRILANNANSAVRRDLWSQYPFHEGLPGLEDADWAKFWLHRDHRVIYEPSAAVFHVHRETWSQVRHRHYREAMAARQIGAKKRSDAVREVCCELLWAISDTGHALVSSPGDDVPRVGTGSLLKEILKFRYHKSAGIIRGLLNGAPKQDQQDRTSLYFESSHDSVVVERPGHVSLKRVVMPEVRPDDVLIKVAYVGVCGTDLEIANGTLGYFANGLGQYPIVPGHEMSGEVAAVGPKVDSVGAGDRVVVECIQGCGHCDQCNRDNSVGCLERKELGVLRLDGAYAGYLRTPSRFVHMIPKDLSLDRAALCEPLAVVLKGVERLVRVLPRAQSSPRTAVVGAGPLGRLGALVLQRMGHRVIVFDQDPRRLADLADVGLTARPSLDRLAEFDAIVEVTGNPAVLETVLEQSAPGASVLLLGLPYGRRSFSFETLVAYDKSVVGSVGSSARHFRQALELLPGLPVDAYLENVMPLKSYAEAWKRCRERDCLKVLLRVG